MHDTLLYNVLIVNEGKKAIGYVVIEGQFIVTVGEGMPPAAVAGECRDTVDLGGAMLLPGVIDDQVHFRDPGLTHKADLST